MFCQYEVTAGALQLKRRVLFKISFMKYFPLLLIFIFQQAASQSLYERKWGAVIPVFNKLKQPFNPARTIKSTAFVSEAHPKTGALYLVTPEENEIRIYQTENPESQSFFKFEGEAPTFIENMKFDSKGNLLITGRTFNPDLATAGAYHTELSYSYSGCWFVAKINPQGAVMWFTYFDEIMQNTAHLSIDKHDNIYILNKRSKTTVLEPGVFQKEADTKSSIQDQDVISKLDKDGKHIWSTFYSSDQSKLLAIEAGESGVFIYGVHLTLAPSATYFGTPGAFQETATGTYNNTSAVFISKFSFDGKRQWSTYFGGQKTFAPLTSSYISKNSSPLSVMGDDAYFITMHSPNDAAYKDQATTGTYQPVFKGSGAGRTVTCFSGKGTRKWTTYIEAGDMLKKSFDEKQLFLTATADVSKDGQLVRTTQNAYQKAPGGLNDVLTCILSADGKEMSYSSWYGFSGNDTGITVPTNKGYYLIGFSQSNKQAETPFAGAGDPANEFTRKDEEYMGNFIGCFTLLR